MLAWYTSRWRATRATGTEAGATRLVWVAPASLPGAARRAAALEAMTFMTAWPSTLPLIASSTRCRCGVAVGVGVTGPVGALVAVAPAGGVGATVASPAAAGVIAPPAGVFVGVEGKPKRVLVGGG